MFLFLGNTLGFQSFLLRLNPVPDAVRRMWMADGHDVVALTSRPAQSLRRSSRDPNRRMRLLHGSRIESDLLEFPKLPLVAEPALRPRLEDHIMRLIHPRSTLFS